MSNRFILDINSLALNEIQSFIIHFMAEEDRVQSEIESIKDIIAKLSKRKAFLTGFSNEIEDQYNTAWSRIRKIHYVLNQLKHPMTVKEIVARICFLENIETDTPDRNLMVSISATLSSYTKKSELISRKRKEHRVWYYMLTEWLDESGKLKRGYSFASSIS